MGGSKKLRKSKSISSPQKSSTAWQKEEKGAPSCCGTAKMGGNRRKVRVSASVRRQIFEQTVDGSRIGRQAILKAIARERTERKTGQSALLEVVKRGEGALGDIWF